MRSLHFLVFALLLPACSPVNRTYGADSMPGLPAPQAGAPQWDHYCAALPIRNVGGREEIARLLEAASVQGWELVAAWPGTFCFKRPHADSIATPASETGPLRRRFSCEVVGTVDHEHGEEPLPGAPERLMSPE